MQGGVDKHKVILGVIFVLFLASKLFFAFQTPNFTYESYYELRHIEHVESHFFPMYNDPLSYQGRKFYFPPLFHYIMAFFATILSSEIAAKIIPSLLFSSLVLLVYAIALKSTRHKTNSLLSALFFAFSPIAFVFPINTVSAYSLALPLFFGVVYFMMRPYTSFNLNVMLLLIIGLVLTHASAFILVIGLLLYLMLLKLEGLEVDKKKIEVILFTILLVFWTIFILYKNAFLSHGLQAVWQNIPSKMLSEVFPSLNIFQIAYFVGLVPLYFGISGAYSAAFKETKKPLLLLLGFALAIFLLLWLNFLRLDTGLLYLSIIMSCLSAQGLVAWSEIMTKSKLKSFQWIRMTFLVGFLIVSSILPLYTSGLSQVSNTPSQEDISALEWVKENTPANSTVISPLKQGHAVTYFAKRKNVMDSNFMLTNNVDERFQDINRIFTLRLKSQVFRVLAKYEVNYIFFGKLAKEQYGVKELYYTRDKNCFTKVYDKDEVQIFRWHCPLEGN